MNGNDKQWEDFGNLRRYDKKLMRGVNKDVYYNIGISYRLSCICHLSYDTTSTAFFEAPSSDVVGAVIFLEGLDLRIPSQEVQGSFSEEHMEQSWNIIYRMCVLHVYNTCIYIFLDLLRNYPQICVWLR